MRRKASHLLLSLLPFVFILLWTFLLYQFPPSEIVDYFGTQNGYLTTLILSFIGGISIIVPVPYHLVLMTFAAGGLNPFLLGLVASIGQACGDTTSYFLGYSSSRLAAGSGPAVIVRFQKWLKGLSYRKFAMALMVYGSVSPFSNDWILVPMGIARYPYRKVMVPLEIGNLVFNTGAGLLGTYGLASILS